MFVLYELIPTQEYIGKVLYLHENNGSNVCDVSGVSTFSVNTLNSVVTNNITLPSNIQPRFLWLAYIEVPFLGTTWYGINYSNKTHIKYT